LDFFSFQRLFVTNVSVCVVLYLSLWPLQMYQAERREVVKQFPWCARASATAIHGSAGNGEDSQAGLPDSTDICWLHAEVTERSAVFCAWYVAWKLWMSLNIVQQIQQTMIMHRDGAST